MIATGGMSHTGTLPRAVLGALAVNLLLALAVAALVSEPLPSWATDRRGCAGAHATVHAKQPPPRPAAASGRHGYLVEARMGWAVS